MTLLSPVPGPVLSLTSSVGREQESVYIHTYFVDQTTAHCSFILSLKKLCDALHLAAAPCTFLRKCLGPAGSRSYFELSHTTVVDITGRSSRGLLRACLDGACIVDSDGLLPRRSSASSSALTMSGQEPGLIIYHADWYALTPPSSGCWTSAKCVSTGIDPQLPSIQGPILPIHLVAERAAGSLHFEGLRVSLILHCTTLLE